MVVIVRWRVAIGCGVMADSFSPIPASGCGWSDVSVGIGKEYGGISDHLMMSVASGQAHSLAAERGDSARSTLQYSALKISGNVA